ncbi:MAG: VIT1/CCC1 family protein [Nitrososphaerota archaeon]
MSRASEAYDIETDAMFFCDDEHFDHRVYRELAKRERNGQRRELLERLAEMERRHYEFWQSLVPSHRPKSRSLRFRTILLLRALLGLTFVTKLLERHESEVVRRYRSVLDKVDGQVREKVEEFLRDEEEHERALLSQIDEPLLRYIGFVALGLSDSMIEVTGVHAGFLGVTASTVVAGVAGLIVGFAASISMGVAAYLKAKSELRQNPIASGFVTGLVYLLSTVLLALPYFATHDMLLAFSSSVALAIAMASFFTFYVAVVNDSSFGREAVENVALIMGTAAATFFFGEFLGNLFGIHGYFR